MKKIITFFALLSFLNPICTIEPEYFMIGQVKKVAKVFSACQKGDFEKAREICDKIFGIVPIDKWDTLFKTKDQKVTILMFAAAVGEYKFVEYLLNKGVAIDTKNNENETALFFAVAYNHPEIVSILLKAGAAKDIKNQKRKTPLESAQQKKNFLLFENFNASSAKQKRKTQENIIKINSIISLLEQDKN